MLKENRNPDYILLGILLALLGLGILILATISFNISLAKFSNTYYFLLHQIIYGLIPGLFLAILFFKMPLPLLKKISLILFIVNIIILILVFVPGISFETQGANRWIKIGKVVFQPSEFLKLTTILYLAAWLGKKNNRDFKKGLKHTKKDYTFKENLLPFLFILAVLTLIFYYQPDVSTLGLIILICLAIYFAAGTPIWHTVSVILMGMGGLAFLVTSAPYRLDRLTVFLKPQTDPLGIGYQMKQSLIAIGSGHVFGQGLGLSSQKFGFLPNPMSDAIFSIFAEETGFLGSIILIILFLLFLWRGIKIVKNSDDNFSQLTALGITSWITIQAFVNIGSLTGLLPLTGIPLPFISYGGSHYVAELMGAAILLNISKSAKI